MNYIEKVFKQYPFVYQINDDYFAFGTGVCAKFDNSYTLLKVYYERYQNSFQYDLDRSDAWKIFRKLVNEANYLKDHTKYQGNPMTNFQKLDFKDAEINELEKQVKQYIDYFQKYNLEDYF